MHGKGRSFGISPLRAIQSLWEPDPRGAPVEMTAPQIFNYQLQITRLQISLLVSFPHAFDLPNTSLCPPCQCAVLCRRALLHVWARHTHQRWPPLGSAKLEKPLARRKSPTDDQHTLL